MGEIYVVVAENNKVPKDDLYYDDGGPIVFEQYVRSADLATVKIRAENAQKHYGKCRVARLVFVD